MRYWFPSVAESYFNSPQHHTLAFPSGFPLWHFPTSFNKPTETIPDPYWTNVVYNPIVDQACTLEDIFWTLFLFFSVPARPGPLGCWRHLLS